MIYEHAIEQAIQHQLDIERKARAWDLLAQRVAEAREADTVPAEVHTLGATMAQFLEATRAPR